MWSSDRTAVWWGKKKFKLKQIQARLGGQLWIGAGKALHAVWSLRGAVGLAAIVGLISIANVLVTVRGKLVILPFEIRSDQSVGSDFGSAFAAGLAASLNDYRNIYPAQNATGTIKGGPNQNSFDVVQSFMADLPFVNIPQSSPLNRGSIAIESVKVGPISLPVGQLVFENLSFFHKDVIRGSVEVWGKDIVARVSFGGDDEIVVSALKDQGYKALISRLSVELLERKNWISPISMRVSALPLFTEGLKNYLDYAKLADPSFLSIARVRYEDALKADRNADLARLHLASTQYISWEAAALRNAIVNFSVLRASPQFQRYARIGYVAAMLRYMERTSGCGAKYQFLDHAIREVDSWAGLEFEELVLRGNVYRVAASYMLPSSQCSGKLKNLLRQSDFVSFVERAEQNYKTALARLASASHFSQSSKDRYGMAIRLEQKYLLNDQTDFSILAKQDSTKIAEVALQAGLDLERQKTALSSVAQQRFFAPYLAGSNAESYLRLASVSQQKPDVQNALIEKAAAQLKKGVIDGEARVASWSMLRLVDLELSRDGVREALEWFSAFVSQAGTDTTPFFDVFDESAFGSGILIEKEHAHCAAIQLLRKSDISSSTFGRLLIADAYRRSGNTRAALEALDELETEAAYATQWVGDVLPIKLALVRAKVDAADGKLDAAKKTLETANALLQGGPTRAMLLIDAYELAKLLNDTSLLTNLKVAINFNLPPSIDALRLSQNLAQSCAEKPQ